LLSNVPEAGSYSLVYEFPIPATTPGWNANPVPYSVDNSTNIVPGSFSRIAYYLEMVTAGGATQWLYVSMSAFTTNAAKIGVPTTGSGEFYHYPNTYDSGAPTNATVLSNVSGITNGTGINTINLEFWPSDFGPGNDYGVPGADGGTFDFGDGGANTSSGHGSMQIHNYGSRQTLFAYNSWGAPPSRDSALGIGNQPSGSPDWVFDTANIKNFVSCTLQILVGNGVVPVPSKTKITLGGYTGRTETLTNFPVLVVLSNNVGRSGFTFNDFVTTNGTDLRFVTSLADTNNLNYEIESWNTGAGQASYVWVQVPTIPADGSGSFWMKWGDVTDSNRLACTTNGATWDANFQGVWHMSEPSARDSTANHNDGTAYNNTTTTNAVMGLAQNFDPNAGHGFEYVMLPAGTALDSVQNNSFTLESWFQPRVNPPGVGGDNTAAYAVVVKQGYHGGLYQYGTDMNMMHILQDGSTHMPSAPCAAGVYHHLVGTVDRPAGVVTLYFDGRLAGQASFPSNSTAYQGYAPSWRIGTAFTSPSSPGVYGWPADGNIDEVRISSVARSADWAWASYMNQASNGVFLSYALDAAQPPVIASSAPSDVMANSASLNGSLILTGSAPPSVTVYWGPNDGGTVPTNWTNATLFPGTQVPGTLSTNLTGLSERIPYYYRFMACNMFGTNWSSVSTFKTRATFSAWNYQMPLTFSGYTQSGPLTNFPVLVVLGTNVEGFTYSQFRSGSNADLAFFDGAQSNELSYDIEQWNPNGLSYVWVKVPLLQDSNTFIRAYWGRSGLTTPSWATNGSVWSDGYSGVWHMQSTNAIDSSTNGNNGTATGGVSSVAGPVGQANSFNGTSGYITVPTTDLSQGSDDVMVEFWVNPADQASDYADIIDYNHSTDPVRNWVVQLYSRPRTFSWAVRNTSNGWGPWEGGMYFTPAVSVWTHMVLMKSGTNYTYYMNGAQTSSGSFTATRIKTATPLRFGGQVASGANFLNGALDEIRISHQARSPAWVWADWMNSASNNVFLNYGLAATPLPMITNSAPGDILVGSASLNGSLVSTGASPATVAVFWGPTDGGEIATAWAHTNLFTGNPDSGPLSTNITGISSNLMCYYRFAAVNVAGTNWAPTAASFLPGEVTVSATAPIAYRPQPGTFTISRPVGATNGALVVNYSVGGSATGGVDYTALPGTVTIPESTATVTFSVTIVPAAVLASSKTVVLTLQPGNYAIGVANSDTVTLHAPSVAFAGAEITSTPGGGSWGTNVNLGYKKDFRSTDSDAKSLLLPGHPNAYGVDGYIVFSSDKGALYSGTYPPSGIYSNTTPYVASVEVLAAPGFLGTYGFGMMDDPSVAIGTNIADVSYGVLFSSWSDPGVQETCKRLKITFGPSAAVAQTIRIGVMTGSGDGQKPGGFGLGGGHVRHVGTEQLLGSGLVFL